MLKSVDSLSIKALIMRFNLLKNIIVATPFICLQYNVNAESLTVYPSHTSFECPVGETLTQFLDVINESSSDIKITQIAASCACAKLYLYSNLLAPGERSKIKISVNCGHLTGNRSIEIGIAYNLCKDDIISKVFNFPVKINVLSASSINPPDIYLGKIFSGDKNFPVKFNILSLKNGGVMWDYLQVVSPSNYKLDISNASGNYEISGIGFPKKPNVLGVQTDYIKVLFFRKYNKTAVATSLIPITYRKVGPGISIYPDIIEIQSSQTINANQFHKTLRVFVPKQEKVLAADILYPLDGSITVHLLNGSPHEYELLIQGKNPSVQKLDGVLFLSGNKKYQFSIYFSKVHELSINSN